MPMREYIYSEDKNLRISGKFCLNTDYVLSLCICFARYRCTLAFGVLFENELGPGPGPGGPGSNEVRVRVRNPGSVFIPDAPALDLPHDLY